jgi:hypothetical protein
MMMKQGAIGFLGSTKVAYGMPGWNEPSDGSSQSLDYFFTTCCTSVEYTQGQAHQWALLEMYTNDLWYYTKFEMFEWGALWGNPNLAMGVASSPPKTPTKPEGPEEWAIDIEATFTSSTTDPDGDNIDYLFDWGDGTDSGWVGPYGSGQTGQASHAWTELGEFQVKAMARDQYGILSEWSEPATIKIVENDPPEKPSKPEGPEEWYMDVEATFTSSTTDPEGNSIDYLFDWGDGTDSGWVGPYGSGQTGQAPHAWTELGEFQVKALARDHYGVLSEWSEPATIKIVKNEPPEKPTISGPKTGTTHKGLKFKFVSTDPEGHNLYYMIHWGDGHYTPYTGPYPSGKEVTFTHSWNEVGDYTIIVKVRDEYGAKSPQNSIKLTITKNRAVTNPVLILLLENLMDHFPLLERLLDLL